MSDTERPSASTHPDELLGGLVDGTLTPAERTEVRAHLDGCERCRGEIRLAESAREALRSLPEVEAPWGLGRTAIEEARKGRSRPTSRRWVAVAGIAAAAVLLVGLSFAVLRGPQGSGNLSAPAAGAGDNAPSAAGTPRAGESSAPFIRREDKNYDQVTIQHLAASYSSRFSPMTQPPAAPVPVPSPSEQRTDAFASATPQGQGATRRVSLSDEESVVACIDSAAGLDRRARPDQVIAARFDEKPALIGIYLSGPGAEQPADLLVIWVASRDCQLLHYASHRIAP
jgi:hypothetical protein